MRIGKLIITIDHTHDHAPHYGKHALKTSIIAVTVASALTLTVFAADYNSHGTLKYDQNSDGTDEIELNGAEIQNLGAAAANQEANLANANDVLTTIQAKNTKLANSTTDLNDKVEGLANTVQASLAKNGVCMNTDGGSSCVIGNYKQALASASSDYNSTAYSGSKTNSSNLNLSDSIGCINNIGKLPADCTTGVQGISSTNGVEADGKLSSTLGTQAQADATNANTNSSINKTPQLMAGTGAWMADGSGLKWYEGTTVNKGSSKIQLHAGESLSKYGISEDVYKTLTAANFTVVSTTIRATGRACTQGNINGMTGCSVSCPLTITYNPSTGVPNASVYGDDEDAYGNFHVGVNCYNTNTVLQYNP